MDKLLQTLNLSREGCFLDTSSPKLETCAVCHEVRGAPAQQGEKFCVSFGMLGTRIAGNDPIVEVGELCRLRPMQPDAVIVVRVWASFQEQPTLQGAERRSLGEARLPLKHLLERCDGCLYQTWIMLESCGLNDSVAGIGLLTGDDGNAFTQALLTGPRQLFQPKACISLCKSEDLDSAGKVLWTASATRQQKIALWGPVLRSQQQHAIMCAAQHLQAPPQTKKQVQEAALLELQRATGFTQRQEVTGPESVQEQEKVVGSKLKLELEGLQDELAKITQEANEKIEAANVRLRSLRREREEAGLEVERLEEENRGLQQGVEDLLEQRDTLIQQKEALEKIVEDLHQSFDQSGGLPGAGRSSIDSVTNFRLH